MRLIHLTPVLLLSLATLPAFAADPVTVDEKDKTILEAFLKHAASEAATITEEHAKSVKTPETFCWVEFPKLNMSLTAYEVTRDVTHLRNYVNGFKNLQRATTKDAEGLRGWYGQPEKSLADPAKPDAVIAEIQTDFRAIASVARFIELARTDPKWNQFQILEEPYISLLEDHFFKRWEPNFSDLGEKGGVYRWNKDYIPLKANITLSHEKQSIMIEGLLNLYRVTKKPIYLERAAKLGTFLKSCLEEKEGRYDWKYWDLAGDWDKNPDGKLRHWIGPDVKGMWFSSTVGSAVILYHHGVVFTEDDIKRFVKTQMEVSWNGDLENPDYKMTNGAPTKDKDNRFIAPSLAPWNEKLQQLVYAGINQEERVKNANSPWKGGVLASDYLRGKYIELPNLKPPKPFYGDFSKDLKTK